MPLRRSLKAAERAQVLQTTLAAPCELEGELVWVREFDWQGRRVIVTYSSKRAHKDRADRQALLDKLSTKLGPSQQVDKKTGEIKAAKPNAQKLITNSGYLRYVEQADSGSAFVLDEDKIASDAAWDGLPSVFGHEAARIYKAFGLKRKLDAEVDRS